MLQYIDDDNAKLNKINKRISIHFPLVKELNYGRTYVEEKGSYDTNYIFVVSWAKDSSTNINYQQFEKFVNDELILQYNFSKPALIFHK